MSDAARWHNIEPMYKAKIKAQDELIKALREKVRVLEGNQLGTCHTTPDLDSTIETHTKIYEAEIIEE